MNFLRPVKNTLLASSKQSTFLQKRFFEKSYVPRTFRKPTPEEERKQRTSYAIVLGVLGIGAWFAPWKSWIDHIFFPPKDDDD